MSASRIHSQTLRSAPWTLKHVDIGGGLWKIEYADRDGGLTITARWLRSSSTRAYSSHAFVTGHTDVEEKRREEKRRADYKPSR